MKRVELIVLLSIATAGCSEAVVEIDKARAPDPPTVENNVERNATKNAFFGDLHVHTQNSFDAFFVGARRTPDEAYRFAKGEKIAHDAGYEIQLRGPPLDFLAVTDHGEYLGIFPLMSDPNHPLSDAAAAQAMFGDDRDAAIRTRIAIGQSFASGEKVDGTGNQEQLSQIWVDTLEAAERHYQPGEFTTFAGYEFTTMTSLSNGLPATANLHRNVIFRDQAPDQIFTVLNSTNPEDLWVWMDAQREAGIESLAIPHNSNISDGEMFALKSYEGEPLTEAYALTRLRNEPLMEITQLKGTSETHPLLSPNDEWAGFELYEYFISTSVGLVDSTVNEGDFARSALARGMALEEDLGVNPYEFGFIGSSDTHVAAASVDEETHWGKFPTDGAGPRRRGSVPPEGKNSWSEVTEPPRLSLTSSTYSASGLVGVWAEANTREDLFDSMRRRETFGTSGPRIKVRLFAGDYDPDILDAADMLDRAYAGGVPMGGNLTRKEGVAPSLIVWAVQDPLSAPLQRLQIIKVWSEGGVAKEAIYDVTCSDGSVPDAESNRCADNGSSVDVSTCETEPGSGSGELKALWKDPKYDPNQPSAYYVRALENPTCRWSTWDAVRAGTPPNPKLNLILQERAWSSPIWVN